MIARLTGKLIQKQPNSVIVDVGGIGYELTVPLSTFYDLGSIGSEVTLRAYTYVREDALQLFGFRTDRERRLFLMLTSVSGIGPKLAITLLSGLSAEDLTVAIGQSNLTRLVSIPGVGKKTAERLVVELRDKIPSLNVHDVDEAHAISADQAGGSVMRGEVVSALVNLGYQRSPAEKAVTATFSAEPDATFEAALKRALRILSS